MIKYKASTSYSIDIEKVEVAKETDSSVFIFSEYKGKLVRRAKRSQYEEYFDSWKDAHACLELVHKQRVDTANRRLDEAKACFIEVLAMKESDE